MPDLTPNHPAVEAGAERFRAEMMGPNWTRPWADLGERAKRKWRARALAALSVTLPNLTADDLRNTPAGRALMAEGWEAACRKVIRMAWADSSDAEYLADEGNPYRKDGDA